MESRQSRRLVAYRGQPPARSLQFGFHAAATQGGGGAHSCWQVSIDTSPLKTIEVEEELWERGLRSSAPARSVVTRVPTWRRPARHRPSSISGRKRPSRD